MITRVVDLLRQSQRPLFVWGAGMRAYRDNALALARSLGVPIATTWGAVDLINHDDRLNGGAFGTHGTRAANFAVQNCDLMVCLGCRLDTKATGTPAHFARAARIVMVDIDGSEIAKFGKIGREVEGICSDAGDFISELQSLTLAIAAHDINSSTWHQWDRWIDQLRDWRTRYAPQGKPYELMREIAKYTTPDDIIVSDTGNTLGWIMQGFPFKGERFIHAFNFTPMGYGISGAVGAAFAGGGRRVVCIVGDGGALMSINELATIARHNLNIKIILLSNGCHAMCKHTQRQWLGGNYYATSYQGGLGFPHWWTTARAFNIPTYESAMQEGTGIEDMLDCADKRPGFLAVDIDPDASLAYQARYGAPIEDSEPALSREELRREMLIPIL